MDPPHPTPPPVPFPTQHVDWCTKLFPGHNDLSGIVYRHVSLIQSAILS